MFLLSRHLDDELREWVRITDRIEVVRDRAPSTRSQLDENQIYVDYGTYAKLRGKIRMGE